MKHTFQIPDVVSHKLKLRALEENVSFDVLLEKACALYLSESPLERRHRHDNINEYFRINELGLPELKYTGVATTPEEIQRLKEQLGA